MKRIIMLLLIINLIFMTGCWDMIELNERAFPYTVGMDVNHEGDEKFEVTFSHPNITALGDQALDDELIHIITAKGDSFFDAAQNLTMELYQPFYFKHLKVMVISRAVAQNKQMLLEVIDGLQRDFITNNNANLLISDSAHELIEYTTETKVQQAIEGTIYSILINNQESNFFTPITASNFIKHMDETGAAIIPIGGFEQNITIGGGVVFKDYEYIGEITPSENRAINIINNQAKDDQFDVEHEGFNLSLMATEVKTKKRLVDKERLKMKITVELEGHIHSHILQEEHEVKNEQILGELEQMAENKVKSDIDNLLIKLQKELNSDVIFISDYLRKFHPSIWAEIKEDYDTIFPNMDIETEVTFHIRRSGLIQ